MKKLIGLLFVAIFSFVIMTAAAPTVFGQKCYCYYKKSNKKPRTATGRQLQKVENKITEVNVNISLLLQIPESKKTPDDSAAFARFTKELADLKQQYDDLEPRVDKLEQDVKDLRTDLNATNSRVDTLEAQCRVDLGPNAKGKMVWFRFCPGKDPVQVEPDGKGGWSIKKTLIVTGIAAGTGGVIWWLLTRGKEFGVNTH